MPAKGKHRRPKALRLSRSLAVAGTGGAALALPLLGATGAHAATPQSAAQSVPGKAVQSVAASGQKTAEQAAGQSAGARTYTVVTGDYLAKIADTQHVDGGWHRLYEDNRAAVGADPSLIHPGLKLSIGAKAVTGGDAESAAPQAAAPKPASAESSSAQSSPAKSSAAQSDASKPAAPQAASSAFVLPVSGAPIGTAYNVAGSMWSSGHHTGVDFVVPTGTSLKAVGAGTVVSAGWGGAYGNQVVIRLADGHYAQYAHLSQLSVSAGQAVTTGQQVGLSGATGNVTGPHLHFEIRTTPDYGSDIDPIAYLRSHGVAV
ncbi:peptidoglycan DD-metalloendopeptidase family protein [Streptomyces adustus]|uniref:Peptidoglycan DD-metalloendopeptidase family protein n=1 Tax=Streptomyces adustus TaxID=1609272 RepID=A0A5N8VRK5_9ACTN|nr:LysM peptidoglycan-binding domain-containing M23 family metallopeptidase [Streptomyces adustus]MPY36505.1 peptidoglycan DD-metalloendopeptidase family protein [Streptomyces adustus]